MPFNRPTPAQILQRLQAEFNGRITGADSRLRRSVENVLARMTAIASHELHGYLAWIARQGLADTADDEMLIRHGDIWGVGQKGSSLAIGVVRFSGTDGSVVPAEYIVRRNDNFEYKVDADIAIVGGAGEGGITALVRGAKGNAEAGVKVNLTNPVPGVQSEAIVIGDGVVAGADVEEPDEHRGRILARIRKPPQGGAAYDYEAWALQISGVTRAWVYPRQYGLGTVGVAFVMDNKAGSIFPIPAEVEIVQEHISASAPTTADVMVFAPEPAAVDFSIKLSPNTLAIQQTVKAEIEDLFKREAKPGGTLYISRIREAISAATGEFDNELITPTENVVMAFGKMPVVGAFTWAGI